MKSAAVPELPSHQFSFSSAECSRRRWKFLFEFFVNYIFSMPPLLAPNFADEEAVARGAAAGWVSFHLQWLGAFVPVKSERRGETGPLALVCLVNHVTRCCSCVSLIEMIEMAPRRLRYGAKSVT